MTTGRHLVRDLHCVACGALLGWRYDAAYVHTEKYKEGKFILERMQIVDMDAAAAAGLASAGGGLPDAMATSPQANGAGSGMAPNGRDFAGMAGPGRPFSRGYAASGSGSETALLLGSMPLFVSPPPTLCELKRHGTALFESVCCYC